ncbi:MAG TPA: hypothetical protein VHV83_18940 [Armatimonadota bacterium]|nr:hypothetical protein [Armatimonadota bacterium]
MKSINRTTALVCLLFACMAICQYATARAHGQGFTINAQEISLSFPDGSYLEKDSTVKASVVITRHDPTKAILENAVGEIVITGKLIKGPTSDVTIPITRFNIDSNCMETTEINVTMPPKTGLYDYTATVNMHAISDPDGRTTHVQLQSAPVHLSIYKTVTIAPSGGGNLSADNDDSMPAISFGSGAVINSVKLNYAYPLEQDEAPDPPNSQVSMGKQVLLWSDNTNIPFDTPFSIITNDSSTSSVIAGGGYYYAPAVPLGFPDPSTGWIGNSGNQNGGGETEIQLVWPSDTINTDGFPVDSSCYSSTRLQAAPKRTQSGMAITSSFDWLGKFVLKVATFHIPRSAVAGTEPELELYKFHKANNDTLPTDPEHVTQLNDSYYMQANYGYFEKVPKVDGQYQVIPEANVAIVVHGICSQPQENYEILSRYLVEDMTLSDGRTRPAYDAVYAIKYPTGFSSYHLNDLGRKVADLINTIYPRDAMGYPRKVDLYAHSMGGLVCRWALRMGHSNGEGSAAAHVKRFITFSSPLLGQSSSTFISFILDLPSTAACLPITFGPEYEDMVTDSSFLRQLSDNTSVTPYLQYAITGTTPKQPEDYKTIPKFLWWAMDSDRHGYCHDGIVETFSSSAGVYHAHRWYIHVPDYCTTEFSHVITSGNQKNIPLNHSFINKNQYSRQQVDAWILKNN